MTFLKKLGSIILQVGKIAVGYGPVISSLLPKYAGEVQVAEDKLSELGAAVVTVEAVGQALGLSGPDKLKAAIPLVGQAISQSALVAGKKIANQTLYDQAMQGFAQATVDLLNSLHEDAAKVAETHDAPAAA
jgi:hypothetical protein